MTPRIVQTVPPEEPGSFGVGGARGLELLRLPGALRRSLQRRGLAYLAVFAVAAVGAGLVQTVTTTYLPLLLARPR